MDRKPSGQPREAKHCWIFLKFGTLALWANTWGCFFHFFKILIFGPWGGVFRPKMDRKPLGQPREAKHCWMFLKFGTLVLLANTKWPFIPFSKILIFGPWVRVFGPKMDQKPSGKPREAKICWMFLKFGTLVLLANT